MQNQPPTYVAPGAANVPPGDITYAPKKAKRWPWIVAIIVALIVGGALGASGSSTDTKTVTKTQTSVVTNDVVSTPEACKTALEQADKLIQVSAGFATTAADVMGAASDGFTAIENSDIDAANAVADRVSADRADIEAATAKVQAIGPVYRAARDECEAS